MWIFGKNQPPAQPMGAATPLQQQRLKQIRSLLSACSNVVEERRDFEYRVPFKCGSTPCALSVSLPVQFPSEKPCVFVSPAMDHPWVDENMQVKGCTQLNLFQMHSDLGKVVHLIIKEFKRNSPRFHNSSSYNTNGASLSQPSPGIRVTSTVDATESDFRINRIYSTSEEVVATAAALVGPSGCSPEVDSIMEKLKGLDCQELEEICANPDLWLDYIHGMQSVVDLQSQRKLLVEQNDLIAKENLSCEPELVDLKLNLKMVLEKYSDSLFVVEEKIRKQDELQQLYEPRNIMNNLRISIMQAEEESEEIADNFLKSDINLDKFLVTFLEKRKTCHLRRMKEEQFRSHIIG